MIDITLERVVSFKSACEVLPPRRKGKKPTVNCLNRWATVGFQGEILDSLQVGSTRCTSIEALTDFFARIARKRDKSRMSNAPPHRAKTAGAKLDALGIQAARARAIETTSETI